jgi:hypothetical protein
MIKQEETLEEQALIVSYLKLLAQYYLICSDIYEYGKLRNQELAAEFSNAAETGNYSSPYINALVSKKEYLRQDRINILREFIKDVRIHSENY